MRTALDLRALVALMVAVGGLGLVAAGEPAGLAAPLIFFTGVLGASLAWEP